MIYTNKMQIFYTKIRFVTKICKVLFISHGRARMNTDTRNISVDQCNQWEQKLPQIARINTDTRNIYILLLATLEKQSFDQREIRNLNYPN